MTIIFTVTNTEHQISEDTVFSLNGVWRRILVVVVCFVVFFVCLFIFNKDIVLYNGESQADFRDIFLQLLNQQNKF